MIVRYILGAPPRLFTGALGANHLILPLKCIRSAEIKVPKTDKSSSFLTFARMEFDLQGMRVHLGEKIKKIIGESKRQYLVVVEAFVVGQGGGGGEFSVADVAFERSFAWKKRWFLNKIRRGNEGVRRRALNSFKIKFHHIHNELHSKGPFSTFRKILSAMNIATAAATNTPNKAKMPDKSRESN